MQGWGKSTEATGLPSYCLWKKLKLGRKKQAFLVALTNIQMLSAFTEKCLLHSVPDPLIRAMRNMTAQYVTFNHSCKGQFFKKKTLIILKVVS